MKTTSAQVAKLLLKAMHETLEKENIDLVAYECSKGEWGILYKGKIVKGGIPTSAIPHALWSVYLFMKNHTTK